MNKTLNKISSLPAKRLPILSDEEAGQRYNRWSYVNIYSLKDLKDIYLISKLVPNKVTKEITKKVNEIIESQEQWQERKVLEYLNALVKFGLLDAAYNPNGIFFENSRINSELSENDLSVLRSIFFNYFRFKELSSWFINPENNFHNSFETFTESDYINNSNLLYFYSDRSRFTDTFLTDIQNCTIKYVIDSEILMRFWDVYLKWALTLKILDKFNVSRLLGKFGIDKEISVAYFIKPFNSFDLVHFIEQTFDSKHILIPKLIFEIVKQYKYSVPEIKSFIVSEIQNNEKLTYERTSEIFLIKGKTSKKNIEAATYLFPKIGNSYVSHLIQRK